jgi:two-component system sensor histidine kinase HydH
MAATIDTRSTEPVHRSRLFHAQDFAWLLFVAALIATDPEKNYNATIVLVLIGAFQIAEPRIQLFSSRRGQVASLALKMVLSYSLVGYTHGIDSFYYLIFLVPIISAATAANLTAVVIVTALACLAYFSFLLPIFVPPGYELPPGQLSVMGLRVSFYAIVAYVVYEQASAKREQMRRTEEAAASLAESNRTLRRTQASLRRSERLAALGQLTAGLAHELRNPLGTIKASAEMLTKESTKKRPDVMSEMASYIGSEVDRINNLVASFLDFARPLQIRPMKADLASAINDVVRQQADLARSREIEVRTNLPKEPIEFDFDAEMLKVAISNLLQNAIQASAPGQTVEIRATVNANDIMILVADHGKGIQPEHLESIFNPFFTTRPDGIGLGLALVSKIIDEHQGRINVFSEPGAGTTFEIVLPKVQTS